MFRYLVLLVLWVVAMSCMATEPLNGLPQPDYAPQATDPAWLARVGQFHGHLGPWVVAGARFGMAGRRAVGAKGYFDIEVTCEGPFAHPPQACFLDGLQVTTGATLGKRTLRWVEAQQIAVRLKNTRTGKAVTLRPTDGLLGLLQSDRPDRKGAATDATGQKARYASLESGARTIASMPDESTITAQPGQ